MWTRRAVPDPDAPGAPNAPLIARRGDAKRRNFRNALWFSRIPRYDPCKPPASTRLPDTHVPQPARKTPSWVSALADVAMLIAIGAVGNACHHDSTAAAPGATTTAPIFRPFAAPPAADSGYMPAASTIVATRPPATEQTIPDDLVGKNGAIAAAELQRLGFENIEYASGTPGVQKVLMMSNSTVIGVEPGAGAVVGTDMPVVLTMVKKNR